jgi:hypothetical protein
MKKKVFRSRISVLVLGSILAVFISTGVSLFYLDAYAGTITLALILLLIISLLACIRYTIVDDRLYLKMFGISFCKIKTTDIISAKRSYDLLSSPAASLKRLCLQSKKYPHHYLISPAREQEFLDTLKSINPDIDIQVSETHGKWRVWDWDI